MTEALITNLGKIGRLRVISRTSAMHYKGTHKKLSEIAKELNVDAAVEGAVLRSGGRVRITAQLVEASSDRHVWAQAYERDLRDVLLLQDELAQTIAKQVQIKLSLEEQTGLATARRIDAEALEAYLQGREQWNKWTEEGVRKSIEYFEQAIAKLGGGPRSFPAGLPEQEGEGDQLGEDVAQRAAQTGRRVDGLRGSGHVGPSSSSSAR